MEERYNRITFVGDRKRHSHIMHVALTQIDQTIVESLPSLSIISVALDAFHI